MIDGSPQVDHLAIELHVLLVEMPAPMTEPTLIRSIPWSLDE